MDFTLTANVFPNGTLVKAYPKSNWTTPGMPSGAPVGTAASEQTRSSDELTFSGLTGGDEYWAVASVGGRYRYVGFTAGADEAQAADQLQGSDVGAAAEAGKVLAADDPQIQALLRLNLGVGLAEGTEQSSRLSNPPDALGFHLKHGTAAKPNEAAGATLKVSRSEKLTKATIEAAEGVAGTDGIDSTPAILGVSKGLEGSEVQAVGVAGMAWNVSKYAGQFADALGIAGLARVSGTGVALASYFESQSDLGATGKQLAVEARLRNLRAKDEYNPGGPSNSMAFWVNAGGDFPSAVAFQIGHGAGQTFEVGYAINDAAVTGSGFRDDSSSLIAFDARKSHATAAFRARQGAGGMLIGADAFSAESALLELSHETARNPVMKITATKSVAHAVVLNNPSGNFNIGQAANNGELMTGTVGGDAVLNTGEKTLHLGRANSTAVIRVGSGLGFFGTSPAVKQTGVAKTAEAIWNALNAYGLIA